MIQAVYIFNNQGKPRLIADYRNLVNIFYILVKFI